MKRKLTKSEKSKIDSWRWRMIRYCKTMEKFCEITSRSQSQVSEWVTGAKTPTPENIKSVERDLKALRDKHALGA